ncbi:MULTISPECIES: alpha-2-macroglobulin family protein [Flavobacteriaceae]|uniref:Alpha-2-macroglobulin n=2 Tax=Flavobacteriaceae TaxID=49546 RepID=A0A4Y8AS44_9FLAO|nr:MULTISPECIES: MG2 domain-containing protein [Flavobacteriaceae]TEW73044.1 alpha-2-macroglobulin [Gramella jeungdoensis]GGK47489.1 alpha-2-macroglobulin [Lutibacter litoralis]
MKNISIAILALFLFSTTAKAQLIQDNYDKLWKEVQQFEEKSLPKSAFNTVEIIYKKAKKESNSAQLIKSLFYKSKYALLLEEDAQLEVVNLFKIQIEKAKTPTKNVLESVLANLYWQYFQQNRYKFYNRTKTSEKVDSLDFRTWDLETLFTEVHIHFQNSLKNGLILQQTDLNGYNPILNLQQDSKKYRPTLFDFLSNNALEFYKSPEISITQPNYKFELDNESYLENYKVFSKTEFEAKDSLSLQLNALKIYKNIIAFHSLNKNTDALISADLERLNFVIKHSTILQKDSIYFKVLQNLKEEFSASESSTLIDFEIASIYRIQASEYNAETNPDNQFKNVEALTICENAINKFPESKGAKNCKQLKQKILSQSINITAEKNIPIDKQSKILVNYKNIETLYFTIFKINENQKKKFNSIYNNEEKITFLKKLTQTTTFQQALKTENDFQQHATEIAIPPLNNGNYLIFASTLETLNANSVYATSTIQVTNMALVETVLNNTYTYQVVDRNSGKPIKNARINLKNYNTNNYNNPINKNYITDKNGQFKFTSNSTYRNVVISIINNNEKASFGDYYLYNYNHTDNQSNNLIITPFLFTDRSIYRPGQVVYFKGILIKKEGSISKVVSNEFVNVALYNVNAEVVSEIELKTNEFGSFSSQFIIPTTGLNGIYTLEVDEGSQKSNLYNTIDDFNYSETQISVEEYKRPKFETTFKPVTETYKINDSITINGSALAFAGSNITDAKVTYRVHRKVQYPRWFYWYKPNFIVSEPQEIIHGETITNAQGNFTITFKALADKNVEKDNLPVFNYEVTADVTDLNGETRSATSIVKVGYHSLIAEINMDAKIDKTKKENFINIETKNLNNQFAPAKGTIKILKLQAPTTVLRKRPWKAPDYQLYTFSEFKNMFPHEPYTNEDEILNWEKGKLVFEDSFNTLINSKIKLKNIKKWQSGNYLVEIVCFDKFGQKVTDKQIVTIFNNKDTQVSDNQLFSISHRKSSYKPNEIVLLKIGSSSKDLTVTIDIEKDGKLIETKIIHLNNEFKQLEIPITKNDFGGFAINYSYVNYNTFESGTLPISVPYPVQELEIETLTFRDKLQPGQNETWSFKLKGTKGEKIAAELLASMYDASLDQFKPHNWQFNPIKNPTYYSRINRRAQHSFGTVYFNVNNLQRSNYGQILQRFDELNWFGFHFGTNRNMMIRGIASKKIKESEGFEVEEMAFNDTESLDEVVTVGYKKLENEIEKPKKIDLSSVKIRTNFNETAFFYPHLKTDKEGNVSFNFTVPEALTQWKLQLLGHTEESASATKTLTSVTQKELMVLPNPPRFLREGDELIFSGKISNLTDKILNGTAQLILTDAISGKEINYLIENSLTTQNFFVDKKGNTSVSWKLNIPEGIQAIQYKIIAKAGDFSDGEQNVLPVLSNRMLVTETLPMWVRSNQTKTFSLNKLRNQTSKTLKNHKLTLEITSNPAWYAVQSLPYLMEYPYECSEQTFSRYYANTLASHVANSNPRIKEVFDLWKNSDELTSNLEKNEELKSIIISETPWLRDAQSETKQKKRIGLLFDLNKMKNEQETALNKLKELQFSNGGFPWFKGSNYPNRYITQHIAASFGHLKQLNVIMNNQEESQKMIAKAVQFLDDEILDDYNKLLKEAKKLRDKATTKSKGIKAEKDYLEKNHLGNTQLHYLYMRSFYKEVEIPSKVKKAVDYYTNQSANYWTDFSLYSKGMIALIQHRNGNKISATEILKSLKENSITSDELGMYWKENTASWFWFQAPIETQALLIEVFSEIENDIKIVDELKVWLLKNKQTNSWKTTKATTEAVYALLLQGSDWLSINETIDVTVGSQKIEPSKLENVKIKAGTGYYKTSWNGNEITPEMANVTISKKDNGIAWGSLYWQYFEDLDKITSAETPLKLTKKLFLKSNSDSGKVLTEITETSTLKVGDLITVRIELKVDRPMEFVHMKDMRASGLEPLNELSSYKWQDGLGYYESSKDASTNFFMERLPKGVYVFEYDLRVNNAGKFSNGITTIQSMYAPEFSSHSEGIRITIK